MTHQLRQRLYKADGANIEDEKRGEGEKRQRRSEGARGKERGKEREEREERPEEQGRRPNLTTGTRREVRTVTGADTKGEEEGTEHC